jgi:hypothetical protein
MLGVPVQERGRLKETLDLVRGPLGSVYSLEDERQLLEARFTVRSAQAFILCLAISF